MSVCSCQLPLQQMCECTKGLIRLLQRQHCGGGRHTCVGAGEASTHDIDNCEDWHPLMRHSSLALC